MTNDPQAYLDMQIYYPYDVRIRTKSQGPDPVSRAELIEIENNEFWVAQVVTALHVFLRDVRKAGEDNADTVQD